MSSGSIGSRETASKSRHQFNYFTIIVLIINDWYIRIILLIQLLIVIPLNLKAWKYITIIHTSGIRCPTNKSVVLGRLNRNNQQTKHSKINVSTRYGWISSDTWFWIICDGRYFILVGSWKLFNIFLVKTSKGDKVCDTFIGNTNHIYTSADIDSVVGLDPGPEGIIFSRRHGNSR